MAKATHRHRYSFNTILMGLSVLFALIGFGILLVVLFNIRPYVITANGGFGFADYKQGIPVEANISQQISDTSILIYYGSGRRYVRLPEDRVYKRKLKLREEPVRDKSDSIFAHYTAYKVKGEIDEDFTVNGMLVKDAKFYLQTNKLAYRLYYTYPNIVNSLVASYCFWLLAHFVSAIQKGGSFTTANSRRLHKIGWAVLILQVAYLVVQFIPPLVSYINVNYAASIPGYRSNFDFNADPVKPFSIMWFLIGALILVIARAFQDGEMLQEDKDLTI